MLKVPTNYHSYQQKKLGFKVTSALTKWRAHNSCTSFYCLRWNDLQFVIHVCSQRSPSIMAKISVRTILSWLQMVRLVVTYSQWQWTMRCFGVELWWIASSRNSGWLVACYHFMSVIYDNSVKISDLYEMKINGTDIFRIGNANFTDSCAWRALYALSGSGDFLLFCSEFW